MENTKLNNMLDELQSNMDFSFVEAKATGKEMTEEQKAAEARLKKTASLEIDENICKILNS